MTKNEEVITKLIRYEPGVLGLFCLGAIFRLTHVPFSSEILIISTSTLSLIYLYKTAVKKAELDSISHYLRKGLLISISIGLIALLFTLQHWPGSKQMSLVFLASTAIIALIGAIKTVELRKLISMTEGLIALSLILFAFAKAFQLI